MDKKPQMMSEHQHSWADGTLYTHEHKRGDTPHGHHGSTYVEPSPKDKVCTHPEKKNNIRGNCPLNIACENCDYWKTTSTQPEPMPLIKLPLRCSRGKACEYLCLDYCSICQFIKVDTTAHDQQVRKDFAEECIKTMEVFESGESDPILKAHIDGAWKIARIEYIAHLRAMAKE